MQGLFLLLSIPYFLLSDILIFCYILMSFSLVYVTFLHA